MELRAGRGEGVWEMEGDAWDVPNETSHERGLRREERAEEVWRDLEGKTRQGCWGWVDMGVSGAGLGSWGTGHLVLYKTRLRDEESEGVRAGNLENPNQRES